MQPINNDITIVSAFFDIGRGEWSKDHFQRTSDLYFERFSYLAHLENDMVIFTSADLVDRVTALRQDKVTQVITVDLENEYQQLRNQISDIQKNTDFQDKVHPSQKQSPEYWSADYVLINHLKTYFVMRAIDQDLIRTSQIAWVDFGYCRDFETLGGLNHWKYSFDPQFMHFFTIKPHKLFGFLPNPRFPSTLSQVYHAMLHNKPYLIGSSFVGHQDRWSDFFELLKNCQNDMFSDTMVDDDQGLYLMCYVKQPALFQLHYLGKDAQGKAIWFDMFKQYQ